MHKLDYGGVDIVNLFSKIDTKVRLKDGLKELVGEETDDFIQKSGEKVDSIIIAWGTFDENFELQEDKNNYELLDWAVSEVKNSIGVELTSVKIGTEFKMNKPY